MKKIVLADTHDCKKMQGYFLIENCLENAVKILNSWDNIYYLKTKLLL